MEKGIVVDIDGTLADVSHRVHHVEKTEKDWASFNRLMGEDSPNRWCLELVNIFYEKGYKIILLTGRREKYRRETEKWLDRFGVVYHELYMRPLSKKWPDPEIKKNIYEEQIRDHIDVLFVLEDRLSVVKMWREIGLVCLQCAWGDF